jgi:hypothetical protein
MGIRRRERDAGLQITRMEWVILIVMIVFILCCGYYGSERLHDLSRGRGQEGFFLSRF